MGPSIDKRNASDRQKNIEINKNKKQLAVQASKQARVLIHYCTGVCLYSSSGSKSYVNNALVGVVQHDFLQVLGAERLEVVLEDVLRARRLVEPRVLLRTLCGGPGSRRRRRSRHRRRRRRRRRRLLLGDGAVHRRPVLVSEASADSLFVLLARRAPDAAHVLDAVAREVE